MTPTSIAELLVNPMVSSQIHALKLSHLQVHLYLIAWNFFPLRHGPDRAHVGEPIEGRN